MTSPVRRLTPALTLAVGLALGGVAAGVAPVAAKALIQSKDIAPGAVTNSKLSAGAVTSTRIRPGAVNSTTVRDGGIAGVDLAPAARTVASGWVKAVDADSVTFDGTTQVRDVIAAPEITQAVLDTYGVTVYLKLNGDTIPLPYTSTAGAGNELSTLSYQLKVGQIVITRVTPDDTPPAIGSKLRYRYVLTPPAVAPVPAG